MKEEKLSKAIVLLFESKLKNYTEATITAWVELMKKYPEVLALEAIERQIYSSDDFPTVGKLSDDIREVMQFRYSENASLLYQKAMLRNPLTEEENSLLAEVGFSFENHEFIDHGSKQRFLRKLSDRMAEIEIDGSFIIGGDT